MGYRMVQVLTCLLLPLASGSVLDIQIDEKKSFNHVIDSLDLLCYVCLLSLTILTIWAFK